MNAAPIPPRDVKPADRPPPRDPQAAGASDGTQASEDARFTDLVKEATGETDGPAKAQDRATAASEAEKAKQADEKSIGDAAAETGTRFAGTEKAWAETAGAETVGAKTASEMTAPAIPFAQPHPSTPPAFGSEPPQNGAEADDATGRDGNGRTIYTHAAGLPGPTELNSASDARKPQSGGEQFEALLTASLPQAEASPTAAATAPAAAARLSEPPTPMAASQPPQPPLPVAALPASIAIKALSGSNRFDIRLNPEELGRIDVALEIDHDGTIRASIAAEKPEALQLIVREARALEQAFDQAGFRRDEGALNFSLSDRQSSPEDQHKSQNRPPMTRFFVDGEGELPPSLAARVNVSAGRADGRLDVRI